MVVRASPKRALLLFFSMLPPLPPDKLPSLEHNGFTIEHLIHHGFSRPNKGQLPNSRPLYGVRDGNGERHWRQSLEEIQSLIDSNFGAQ